MLNYTKEGKNKGWYISQEEYLGDALGKTESTFTLGNGYLGLRSSDEEKSPYKVKNMFINGVFNQADENEVTELANIADIIEVELKINGKSLLINEHNITAYEKTLDIYDAILTRNLTVLCGDITLNISTERFVSHKNLHLVGQKISISADKECDIEILTGIDGQVTNSGAQHFFEGNKRMFGEIMHHDAKTYQSGIEVAIDSSITFNEKVSELILMDRRKIFKRYRYKLSPNKKLAFEKLSTICSTFDKEYKANKDNKDNKDNKNNSISEYSVSLHKESISGNFDELKAEHVEFMHNYWKDQDIKISGNDYVQLVTRFAMYSLRANTNIFDSRTNIGAKGMTGEGYKGHAFWDTEIFMLPYFIYSNPEAARNLVHYRHLGLKGARKKAKFNDYEGAMYPWEAASPEDGEVTPIWGAADIITGKPTKIMSGFIEQHITADVSYGVWLYYNITGDHEFMEKYGYEIILDTAKFWSTRVEERNGRYEITNVIGPDEYKEEIDNNAFTNIMAKWNIDLALNYIGEFGLDKLVKELEVDTSKLKDVSEKIYIPQLTENKILPQNDTFLDLERIDLSKYKKQSHVGSLFEDYNLEQVNKIQVSKQADTMLLFLLMEDMYDHEAKVSNFNFYEPITMHDSSLSLSTHVVLAADLKLYDLAKNLFEKSLNIDLGQNMKTSDHGIHTAAQGGMWQSIVYGLGGIRFHNGLLRVEPNFFGVCDELEFNIYYKGQPLHFKIDAKKFAVTNNGNKEIKFKNQDKTYTLNGGETKEVNYV